MDHLTNAHGIPKDAKRAFRLTSDLANAHVIPKDDKRAFRLTSDISEENPKEDEIQR